MNGSECSPALVLLWPFLILYLGSPQILTIPAAASHMAGVLCVYPYAWLNFPDASNDADGCKACN